MIFLPIERFIGIRRMVIENIKKKLFKKRRPIFNLFCLQKSIYSMGPTLFDPHSSTLCVCCYNNTNDSFYIICIFLWIFSSSFAYFFFFSFLVWIEGGKSFHISACIMGSDDIWKCCMWCYSSHSYIRGVGRYNLQGIFYSIFILFYFFFISWV